MIVNPSISAFFPAFNEEANIAASIIKAREVLTSITNIFEIIIVDDGSEAINRFLKYVPGYRIVIGYRSPRRNPLIRLINAKGCFRSLAMCMLILNPINV